MTLNRSTSLCCAAALDDVVNQLAILGTVMPTQLNGEPEACVVVSREIANVIKDQQTTEGKLEAVLSARGDQIKEAELVKELQTLMSLNMRGTELSMDQSPLSKDNYIKIQQDRLYLEQTLFQTQVELIETNSFASLMDAIRDENQSKLRDQNLIIREEQSRIRVKELQHKIASVHRDTELELEQCNERIAYLKDQLQEMKAKGNMEAKYIKNNSENFVDQGRRRGEVAEAKLTNKLEAIVKKQNSERRTNEESKKYYNKHYDIMVEKLDFWMEKWDVETDAKQHELDTLIRNKAEVVERLAEMTIKYAEWEKEVVHYRIEQEKVRRKKEEEELELNSATLLQSWWRAFMQVRRIGTFAKKSKGGKGKHDKKKGRK